jgi:hypothetical protein
MRRTYRTLNDCEMQHNAEVGLFTRPSQLEQKNHTQAHPMMDNTMRMIETACVFRLF